MPDRDFSFRPALMRNARLSHKWTFATLALKSGTAVATLKNWENGKSRPSHDRVTALENVLGKCIRDQRAHRVLPRQVSPTLATVRQHLLSQHPGIPLLPSPRLSMIIHREIHREIPGSYGHVHTWGVKGGRISQYDATSP